MRVYEPAPRTSAATIERYREVADRGRGSEATAMAWTEAGFDDEATASWLEARCFDPGAAHELAELGVTPKQATARTRDGGEGGVETIAHKVASGELTPRQGAARCLSSR